MHLLNVSSNAKTTTTTNSNYSYPRGVLPCKLFETSKLDCSYRNLSAIPPLPTTITEVYLNDNKIRKLEQGVFSGKVNLTVIELQYNNVWSIEGRLFSDLVYLTNLTLRTVALHELYSTTFNGLCSLRYLDLSYNFLTSLPNEVFSDLLSLRELSLKHNNFTVIPNNAFAPLRSLKILDLTNSDSSFTSFILPESFRNLTNLTSLKLRSSNVSRVTNDTFVNVEGAQLSDLEFLWDNDGVEAEKGVFTPLRNVHELRIGYSSQDALPFLDSELENLTIYLNPPENKLTPSDLKLICKWNSTLTFLNLDFSYVKGIYDSPFTCFSNLKILHFCGVPFSMQYISEKAFYGLHNLTQLYLKGNQINTFPENAFNYTFSGTGSLRFLDLSYNSLTGLFSEVAFTSVSSLEQLDLSHNPIRYIGPWIHALTNLKILNLNGITSFIQLVNDWTTPLTSLNNISFENPLLPKIIQISPLNFSKVAPKLLRLSLKGTSLFQISTIGNLTNLGFLDLSKSLIQLAHLKTKWGREVRLFKLKQFHCASNKLTSVADLFLNVTMPNVTYLDLSDNSIQDIGNETFYLLRNLQYLYLGNNNLRAIGGIVRVNTLIHLNLSHNSISTVSQEFVQLLNTSGLTNLDLSGNPFDCTCAIEPFRKWILSDDKVILAPNKMYICNTPGKLATLSITEINLDCKSHLLFYIIIGVPSGLALCLIVTVVIYYRWHIRYSLFLICHRYKYTSPEEDDENASLNRVQYDVFVSYAHENEPDLNWVLNDLQPNLEEGPEPFRLCIGHARDFTPGTPLLEAITEAIHNSRKTIIVLSPSYLDSEWCYFETQHAWLRLLNEGKDVIILVLLKPIPDGKMTMWLRQFLCKKGYLRWPHDRPGQILFWRYLREMIKKKTLVDRRYDV